MRLPQPDPHEYQEPQGLQLHAPIAVFLDGEGSPRDDHVADAVLEWRPGMLVIVR